MKLYIIQTIVTFKLIFLIVTVNAQDTWRRPISFSFFTVATQLPGGKMTPIHPGLEIGSEFRYNRSEKNQWLQTIKTGIYYHQFSQTAIQLYTELDYRKKLWQKLKSDVKLGAGYLHAFPDLESFILKDGSYEIKRNYGRSQLMLTAAVGLRYQLSALKDNFEFFITYQCFFQLPFIKSYVPVLPNTALHVGVSFPVFRTKNQNP
jgi:hypothetical protein